MKEARYHMHRLANHVLHPQRLMLGYSYDPLLSERAVKPLVFLTSTFVFRSAEEGRDFFDYAAGRREPLQRPDRGVDGAGRSDASELWRANAGASVRFYQAARATTSL